MIREWMEARRLTDRLFEEVHEDAYLERPIPERHRILFYLGHLEAFDANLLKAPLDVPPVSAELDRLFAFGIDPPPGELPQDRPVDWPSLAQTRAYVKAARDGLDRTIASAPPDLLAMAIEHRLMHAETFTYILHNLPYERRHMCGSPPVWNPLAPPQRMCRIPAGQAILGRARTGDFGWDNEFEEHCEFVPAFGIGKYKVTNGDYLAFVCDGGPPPHYWVSRNGHWGYRGMFGEVPIPNDWPVYASLAQARAYAEWAGKRLPGEAEWHRASSGAPPAFSYRGNFDFAHRDLIPVSAAPEGDSEFGVSQLVGNGWEWTSTPFAPFPGFASAPQYPGYSANFFDGDHYVLKGGSCATKARLLRPAFRNWFRQDYPYAYATFRLAED